MSNVLMKRLGNKKGFTLIELIVVIAIIAILAAVLIPRFIGFSEGAREKSVLSDARNILLSLEALDASDEWPADLSATVTAVNNYVGKTIITEPSAPAAPANNDSWLTAAPTRTVTSPGGITFTYRKQLNDKVYTVTSTLSEFGDVTVVAP